MDRGKDSLMEEIKTKICPKCGEEKPLTGEFWHKANKYKDGVQTYCRQCRSIIAKIRNGLSKDGFVKECPCCGNSFSLILKPANSVFCSTKCARLVQRNRLRESIRKKEAEYRAKNKELIKKRNAESRKRMAKENPALLTYWRSTCGKRRRAELREGYIKDRLHFQYGYDFVITDELIQLKKQQLKMYRFKKKIKEVTNGCYCE